MNSLILIGGRVVLDIPADIETSSGYRSFAKHGHGF